MSGSLGWEVARKLTFDLRADAKLAEHARVLKQRNRSLLNATASVSETDAGPKGSSQSTASAPNPVHAVYITTLEQQLTTLRDEIAVLYKTQGQNAQRLLLMNESLREKEQESLHRSDLLTRLQVDHDRLQRQAEDYANVIGEKERGIQILQDELTTLSLELSQIESRNHELKKDNASLLQRWLDRMNQEADKMNEGTIWLEQVRKQKQASPSLPAEGSSSAALDS